MKRILFALLPAIIVCCFSLQILYAQSPHKLSYQAVVRNASNTLVANQPVGIRISILQETASGTVVYQEIYNPNPITNANGLVSVEIGSGISVTGTFIGINWAVGPYFIKTEIDPAGGTAYSITGISQLLSVPYAMHAKSAESITGGITESDPLWLASPSFGITGANISNWNTTYAWGNHATAGYLTNFSENDPLWKASPSFGITGANLSNWNAAHTHSTSNSGSVHGSTTVGSNLLRLSDPSAVSFLMVNTDNTVSPLNAADFRNAIGAGTGNGTVTNIITGDGITGGPITAAGTIGLTGQALALHSLNTNGFIVRTGAGVLAARSIAVSGNGISIANGDGVGGNPSISLNIGTGATQVAAGNHAHGNLTTDGKIGSAAGRIITTGSGGTLQATAGTAPGEMLYWDGSAWINVPPGSSGQILTFENGRPAWASLLGAGTGNATDVYNPATGKIWMDRNLGATQIANGYTDAGAYGFLFQWGRGADGHQIRTSGTTNILSTGDSPGNGLFILISGSPYDWRSPQNHNLWQGVNGINNPCPSGYRLPTDAEWNTERLSWKSNNAEGAFASALKLTLPGTRFYSSGVIFFGGESGYYWTSTVDGIYAKALSLGVSSASTQGQLRGDGMTVRCIKD
jgi:hypothetical protein